MESSHSRAPAPRHRRHDRSRATAALLAQAPSCPEAGRSVQGHRLRGRRAYLSPAWQSPGRPRGPCAAKAHQGHRPEMHALQRHRPCPGAGNNRLRHATMADEIAVPMRPAQPGSEGQVVTPHTLDALSVKRAHRGQVEQQRRPQIELAPRTRREVSRCSSRKRPSDQRPARGARTRRTPRRRPGLRGIGKTARAAKNLADHGGWRDRGKAADAGRRVKRHVVVRTGARCHVTSTPAGPAIAEPRKHREGHLEPSPARRPPRRMRTEPQAAFG
jgi:hypothetical protein